MFKELPIGVTPKQKKVSLQEILKHRVLPSDEIPKPECVLYFHDQMVMTRKNISCITGKAKVGKTFLMTLLNETILMKGDFHNTLKSFLPKGKDKIIYIDTEQSDYHILLILKRIKDVVSDEKIENLYMFNFDAIDIEKRKEYTRELIYAIDGVGLVVIDGIADLIYDPNDIRESSQMVSDLRKWSVEKDLHIVNVIHQNPSENQKMRGHLGTILTNKSETVIQISSSKENESVKLVETLATRNKKPNNWSFEIINGIPEIMQECYEEPKIGRKKAKELNDIERYSLLNLVFSTVQPSEGLQSNILVERIRCAYIDTYGETSVRKIEDFVKYCKEMCWLVSDGHKKPFFLYPFKPS
jgi:hypothetical protein